MKTWLKILIVAVVIGLIGLGIYFVFKPQPLVVEDLPTEGNLPAGQLPNGGADGNPEKNLSGENQNNETNNTSKTTLTAISDRPVVDFWTSGDNIFYLDQEGKVFKARTNEDEEVATQTLGGPLNYIDSDATGNLTLISFGSPLNPSWTIFDSRDTAYRPLAQEISYAAWGNKTGEIIAIKKTPAGTNQLVYLEADKLSANPKIILSDFQMKSVRLVPAGGDEFLLYELPDAEYAGKIWLLNTKTQSLNLLRDAATNQIVKRGSNQIFFVWSGGNNFEINTNSKLTNQIPVPFSTLPQKCGASGYLAFCLTPQTLGENSMDSFLKNKTFFRDTLYKIDTSTEDSKIINLEDFGVGAIDGKNPRVAGSSLVFINRLDKKIYQLTNFQ